MTTPPLDLDATVRLLEQFADELTNTAIGASFERNPANYNQLRSDCDHIRALQAALPGLLADGRRIDVLPTLGSDALYFYPGRGVVELRTPNGDGSVRVRTFATIREAIDAASTPAGDPR